MKIKFLHSNTKTNGTVVSLPEGGSIVGIIGIKAALMFDDSALLLLFSRQERLIFESPLEGHGCSSSSVGGTTLDLIMRTKRIRTMMTILTLRFHRHRNSTFQSTENQYQQNHGTA